MPRFLPIGGSWFRIRRIIKLVFRSESDLTTVLQEGLFLNLRLEIPHRGSAHVAYGAVTILLSNVTAPLRAKALPTSVAPVSSVIDCSDMMVPLKTEFVPNVAELPVCQKTFLAWALPARITCVLPMVVSVDPTWKMKTAFASPNASRVTLPADNMTVLEVLYRPGVKVSPLRSPGRTAPPGNPAV